DLADGGIQPVDDVDVAVVIDLKRVQVVQGRLGGRAAVTGVALAPAARDRRDDAGSLVDAADRVGAPVADVEVARRVEVTPVRFADQRSSRRATVACVASLASPHHRLNLADRKRHALFPSEGSIPCRPRFYWRCGNTP